ncbi:MAG: hypothetical protein JWR16_1676 [Nevskia sp.]|nr:hypothetical protein [Nevskia sp.]
MFNQAFWISLRILIFRAGPEDFPFDGSRRLLGACVALAFIVNVFAGAVALPLYASLFTALAVVGSYAVTARSALVRRGLMNRFQQTLNALLVTNALLTLAVLPALIQIAPVIIEFIHQVQQNPDLANHAEQWPHVGLGLELWFDLTFIWQFAIGAYIFKRATNTSALVGVLFVLMLGLVMLGLNFFASLLVAMTMA